MINKDHLPTARELRLIYVQYIYKMCKFDLEKTAQILGFSKSYVCQNRKAMNLKKPTTLEKKIALLENLLSL